MAARLVALRDDRIRAGVLQPARLLRRRGAREENASGLLERGDRGRLGHAVMEADDRRAHLQQCLHDAVVELGIDPLRLRHLADAEFLVIGLQPAPHARDALGIRRRILVHEEVQVIGLVRRLPDLARAVAQRLPGIARAAERAEPAGIGHRGDDRRRRRACHRRLDDRMLAPDQFLEKVVRPAAHQLPELGIEAHGSAGSRWPFWRSKIEIPSGDLTNAICPSRGGRLMVIPWSINRWQVA